ncbi:hypothetical protein, partial [Limnospira sp. PMC 289.06]|uniref:hypothetical protein n=1 Tax=Limnospira sp. PMC 289.06 TaxID=2981094 RepID=UPI0028E15120|nr:hypothetical protein [Limnospira sp. PMC 289.06]
EPGFFDKDKPRFWKQAIAFPTTQESHIPVGAGSTAYILLHQQRYKPAPFFEKPRFWKQAIAFPTTQESHIPVGAGSTAYILLHQQ